MKRRMTWQLTKALLALQLTSIPMKLDALSPPVCLPGETNPFFSNDHDGISFREVQHPSMGLTMDEKELLEAEEKALRHQEKAQRKEKRKVEALEKSKEEAVKKIESLREKQQRRAKALAKKAEREAIKAKALETLRRELREHRIEERLEERRKKRQERDSDGEKRAVDLSEEETAPSPASEEPGAEVEVTAQQQWSEDSSNEQQGAFSLPVCSSPTPGGRGGTLLLVTRLDDDAEQPQEGSLRWAVEQPGARTVEFDVEGTIELTAPLVIREPYLTVDGRGEGRGICLSGYPLCVRNNHDVVLCHLRLRSPEGSSQLGEGSNYCIELEECQRVVLDHCSLSSGTDRLVSAIDSQEVSLQWCLLSDPTTIGMGEARAAVSDEPAIIAANSGLSVHHCLLGIYGEPSLLSSGKIMMTGAVHNVFFDFDPNDGCRTALAAEDGEETRAPIAFHWLDNCYIGELPAEKKGAELIEETHPQLRSLSEAYRALIDEVGCLPRDALDSELMAEVERYQPHE